ncbi:MAG: hypothetical protein ACM3S4_04340 [Burkholderiales bacterium]
MISEGEIQNMNSSHIKHLEFIQTIITRMNKNSFQIKGWSVTIVSAFLALYANSNNTNFLFVAIVPTIIFWMLDSYYLQKERKYRGLYNDVANINSRDEQNEIKNFELSTHMYSCNRYCYFSVLFSKTIIPLYGTMMAGLFIAGFILK